MATKTPRVTLTCTQCGKTFERTGGRAKQNAHSFCSRECQNKWRKRNMYSSNGREERSEELVRMGRRIAQMALESRLDEEQMLSLASLVTRIAYGEYQKRICTTSR